MTETLKINLTKTLAGFKAMGYVAGFLIACFVAYANIDERMDKLELEAAQFKGVIDERTRNTQEDVRRIYDIVKEWSPDGQTAKKD